MRNYVAKHDHNRASVHTDQKKAWEPDILEGIEEHLIEISTPKDESYEDPCALALKEYERGISAARVC